MVPIYGRGQGKGWKIDIIYDINYLANSKLETGNIFDPSKNQRIQERKICHLDQVARDRNRIDEVLVPLVIHLEMGISNFRLE